MAGQEEYPCDICNYVGQTAAALFLHKHVRHLDGGLDTLKLAVDPLDKRPYAMLNPDEKRIRARNQVVNVVTNNGAWKQFVGALGQPIDVYVDEFCEIWWRRDSKPDMKICGAHKKTNPEALCTHQAGWGTSHSGYGRCRCHLGTAQNPLGNGGDMQTHFFQAFLQQDGHSLANSLRRIHKMATGELFDISTPLRVLYTILDNQLQEGGEVTTCGACGAEMKYEFSKTDLSELRKTIAGIRDLIKTDAEVRSKLVLDPLSIWVFINGLMDVILPYIKRDDRVEVIDRIMNNVVLPLGDRKQLVTKDVIRELDDQKT